MTRQNEVSSDYSGAAAIIPAIHKVPPTTNKKSSGVIGLLPLVE
jgi:hypothetical protein